MAKLGFIGLGVMGGNMVARLLEKGHTVTGYNRTRSKAQWLIDRGMKLADSPKAVAAASDVTFTMVTNSAALAAVTDGPDGLLAGMAAGKVTSNRHRKNPRCRRRTCPRYGPGWKMVRSFASRAMISSDIRLAIVRVQQQQRDRRPTAIPSRSGRAFRFWITTVRHAPKLSRRTNPRRPGGLIATCLRPRHLLSPGAPAQGPAQGNDAPVLSGSTRSFSPFSAPRMEICAEDSRPSTPTPSPRLSWISGARFRRRR